MCYFRTSLMINRFLKSGKKLHEHVNFIGHQFLSLFIIPPKYNGAVLTAKVFTKQALRKIIAISDDASANGKWLLLSLKQLCWIHEIRHYLKLVPSVPLHKRQVDKITGQLWAWYRKAKDYGRDPTPQKRKALETEFDRIVSQRTGGIKNWITGYTLPKRKRNGCSFFLIIRGCRLKTI